jgi:hypothetical protein
MAGAIVAALYPAATRAQNITGTEIKLGLWDHDVRFLGGREHGADINGELLWQSPVPESFVEAMPWWTRWTLQPRPTIGAAINTAGQTDQFYVGPSWGWMLLPDIVNPGDGIFANYFFGPGFNDGQLNGSNPQRKALGSHILFREALDLGYQFNPTWNVSLYIDHISNGGFAKYNQSINDVGLRLGYRF